jgi:hypothetical protein
VVEMGLGPSHSAGFGAFREIKMLFSKLPNTVVEPTGR